MRPHYIHFRYFLKLLITESYEFLLGILNNTGGSITYKSITNKLHQFHDCS